MDSVRRWSVASEPTVEIGLRQSAAGMWDPDKWKEVLENVQRSGGSWREWPTDKVSASEALVSGSGMWDPDKWKEVLENVQRSGGSWREWPTDKVSASEASVSGSGMWDPDKWKEVLENVQRSGGSWREWPTDKVSASEALVSGSGMWDPDKWKEVLENVQRSGGSWREWPTDKVSASEALVSGSGMWDPDKWKEVLENVQRSGGSWREWPTDKVSASEALVSGSGMWDPDKWKEVLENVQRSGGSWREWPTDKVSASEALVSGSGMWDPDKWKEVLENVQRSGGSWREWPTDKVSASEALVSGSGMWDPDKWKEVLENVQRSGGSWREWPTDKVSASEALVSGSGMWDPDKWKEVLENVQRSGGSWREWPTDKVSASEALVSGSGMWDPDKWKEVLENVQRSGGSWREWPTDKVSASEALTIEKLPEKVLLHIFGYLSHREILKCATVCRKWKNTAFDSRLWKVLSLRPAYDGLQVRQHDELLRLTKERFAPDIRYIELPTEHVTVPIIQELAKCPKLEYMTLDFSTAAQLHDFSEMQAFPSRLKSLSLCLSENIFLEGFLRKIYSYISSVQTLHLIGTYEKIEDEEEEVYETVNLHKLKQHLPNLRTVNLWGVVFIKDEHIESLSSNCAQIECLCVNYCQKVDGSSLKVVLSRLKKLKSLLLEQCGLDNKAMMAVEWEKSQLQELNVTGTDLSSEALVSILTRLPHLKWLSAGYLEGFTDQVMEAWMESGASAHIQHLDLNTCDILNENVVTEFVDRHGHQLRGLNLGGHHKLTENFWGFAIPRIPNIKTLVMGIAVDCCAKVQAKIHVDHFMDQICHYCTKIERLEVRWDSENIRFSDKSSKFIDMIRMRCLKLRSLVLSDGQFYEMVRGNFERAERLSVVRTTQMCITTLVERLTHFKDLLFN